MQKYLSLGERRDAIKCVLLVDGVENAHQKGASLLPIHF